MIAGSRAGALLARRRARPTRPESDNSRGVAMPNAADMRWFKDQFHDPMDAAVRGTPLSVDFLTAIACQETGEIWPSLRRKSLSVNRILELCVGDTIDGNGTTGRSAFPRNKSALLAAPRGRAMFDVARQALVD